MTEPESIAYFVRETVSHARSLPFAAAADYLHGVLALVGNNDAVTEVRRAYVLIREGDSQLELIASGQLKLNLQDGGARDKWQPEIGRAGGEAK